MGQNSLDPSKLTPGRRRDEIAAVVALIRTDSVQNDQIGSLVDQVGSAVRLIQQDGTEALFPDVPVGSHDVAGTVSADTLATAVEEVERWLRRDLDIRLVTDADYPSNLHEIHNRPAILFFEGRWDEKRHRKSVAVVGTRSASEQGLERAEYLASGLVEAGYTVISGMATGIDTAAHEAALGAGGRTAAVMGTGLDHRYPSENRGLADRIVAQGGSLVTQFFPHQRPRRWTFGLRNVVMSGLALGTVVVEASHTSGAKMQARLALEHGRPVFLVDSLVEGHEWAHKYATQGKYGAHAVRVETPGEIVRRLEGKPRSDALTAIR